MSSVILAGWLDRDGVNCTGWPHRYRQLRADFQKSSFNLYLGLEVLPPEISRCNGKKEKTT